jgi:hypothetical protein
VHRAFVVSLVVHVALCLVAASGALLVQDAPERERAPITFELTIDETERPPSEEGVDGKSRAGIEDARPTGQPDHDLVGRAGDRMAERASGVHRIGESERERVTASEVSALAEALGASARVESPTMPTGTRDESVDGLASTGALVSPGTRGLDMIGTGHGSGPHGDDEGIGNRTLGLGSLGASTGRGHYARSRRTHALCVIEGCRPHRMPWVLVLRILVGPLDARRAQALARRVRPLILACGARHERVDLVIAADGHAIASSSSPRAPCVEAALRAVPYPPAAAPSRATVRIW